MEGDVPFEDRKYKGMTRSARVRVNGNSLIHFHQKAVCLLGTVIKASEGGMAFTLRAPDGQPINIRLKTPQHEAITGLVEVYGTGQGKNLIVADTFTTFPPEISSTFDMQAFNDCLNLLHSTPNPWMLKKDRDELFKGGFMS